MEDLSHVYANEPDEGQEEHGKLPNEAMDHFAAIFAHKAGLGTHPGVYKGPKIKKPEGFESPKDPLASPEDQENATSAHQDQAIANVSDFGNSPNVLSPHKPKPLPSMGPT